MKRAKPKPKQKRKPREAAPGPAPPATGYEYDYIEIGSSITKEEIIAALNRMGQDSWKFIEIMHEGGMYRVWFMRGRNSPQEGAGAF